MRTTRSITINAPIEKVWKIIAHEFDKVDRWASGVMAGRVLMTPFGKCYERFEKFDEQQYTVTYVAQFEKKPSGLKSTRNTWSVETISSSQVRVTMSARSELNLFPGLLMQLPMRFQVPRTLDMNLESPIHGLTKIIIKNK